MTEKLFAPLRFDPTMEQKIPDEDRIIDEISAVMQRLSRLMYDRYRHALRSVHAKSHGLLKGELRVLDNLPEPLRQGLFAKAASYPLIIRLSTTPGDMLADSVSTPRGMSIKVIGVEGAMTATHAGNVTQDFVLVNGRAFPVPDLAGFLKQQQMIEKHADDSESFKKTVSAAARTTNAVLSAVGAKSAALDQLGHPETHILGEAFCSIVPLRWGDYVAKVCVVPASESLKALEGKPLAVNGHYSALKDAVVEFFKTERAEWEVRVQLCRDIEKMPIEDASVEWPEEVSPYEAVGRIVVEPQEAYSPERLVYVDERMSFSPWHSLDAHRPLGNIMRGRLKAYEESKAFRQKMNGRVPAEPRTIAELPN